jgi:hypothetical protein
MPGGRPTDYRADFHPHDCIRLGLLGKFKVQMARDWGIGTNTLDDWRRNHEQFSTAYNQAANFRTAWWLDQAQEGLFSSRDKQFNPHTFAMIMRYDGQPTEERKIKLVGISKCKTAREKFDVLWLAFEAGDITPREAQTIADVLKKDMDATEVKELSDRVEKIDAAILGK